MYKLETNIGPVYVDEDLDTAFDLVECINRSQYFMPNRGQGGQHLKVESMEEVRGFIEDDSITQPYYPVKITLWPNQYK